MIEPFFKQHKPALYTSFLFLVLTFRYYFLFLQLLFNEFGITNLDSNYLKVNFSKKELIISTKIVILWSMQKNVNFIFINFVPKKKKYLLCG